MIDTRVPQLVFVATGKNLQLIVSDPDGNNNQSSRLTTYNAGDLYFWYVMSYSKDPLGTSTDRRWVSGCSL